MSFCVRLSDVKKGKIFVLFLFKVVLVAVVASIYFLTPSSRLDNDMKAVSKANRLYLTLSVKENVTEAMHPQEKLQDLCQGFEHEPVETDPSKSYWHFLTSNPKQGSPIHISLTVKSSDSKTKTGGGDLIYSKIASKVPLATQFGKIYDYDNGTYLIEFNPSWAGYAEIEVKMFLSSRAGYFTMLHNSVDYAFDCVYEKTPTDEKYFASTSMGPLRSSYVKLKKPFGKCRFGTKPFAKIDKECNVSLPRHYWFGTCTKPVGSSCDEISWCYFSKAMSAAESRFTKKEKISLNNSRKPIAEKLTQSKKKSIMIQESDVPSPKNAALCSSFSSIRSQGHWFGKVYKNSVCSVHCNSIQLVMNCLKNSKLLFIGDSTLRIVVDEIRYLLRGKRAPLPQVMFFKEDFPNRNLSIWYTFHGLPIRTSHSLHFSTTNWTSQIFDDIGTTDKLRGYDNVIFNTNHHFASVPTEMFKLKMKDISDSLDRLYKRMPTTTLIYVAANARGAWNTRINDYKLRYFNDLAKEFLGGKPNVVFLDIWEMFLGSPYKLTVHYHPDVILEEIKLLCSIFRHKPDCTK